MVLLYHLNRLGFRMVHTTDYLTRIPDRMSLADDYP